MTGRGRLGSEEPVPCWFGRLLWVKVLGMVGWGVWNAPVFWTGCACWGTEAGRGGMGGAEDSEADEEAPAIVRGGGSVVTSAQQ